MTAINTETSREVQLTDVAAGNRLATILAWSAAFAVVAVTLVAVGFTSQDPDSTAYAAISARLAGLPVRSWIAPEWAGRSPLVPFREHPVGVFLLPALAGRLGIPPMPAAFVVGLAFSIAALFLLQRVAVLIVGERDAAIVPWVALVLPAAFINRVRATQEYPVLVFVLLAVLATEKSRTSTKWILVSMAAACATALFKGVFVVFVPIICGLWLLCTRDDGHGDLRAWSGVGLSMVAVLVASMLYESLYHRATGDSFLNYYLPYRLGQIATADSHTSTGLIAQKFGNVAWYSVRTLWFAFPGTLAFGLAAVSSGSGRVRATRREVKGLCFAAGVAAAYIVVMSLGATRAERFIFPAYFAVGIAGMLVAVRQWRAASRLAAYIQRLNPCTLALAWLLLVLAAVPVELYLPYVKFRP